MSKREQARQKDHERRIDQQEHSAATQVAADDAKRRSIDPRVLRDESFVDEVFSPGIDRKNAPDGRDNDLEDFLSAEFSRHVGMGNITREDWEHMRDLNKAQAQLAMQEFRRPGGIGSKCTGASRERLTGGDSAEKPVLTDDRARSIRAAFDERTRMESLSIDARGWRGLVESIVQVRRDESSDGSDDSRLFSFFDDLF